LASCRAGFLHVASNIRVAGSKENAFGQRSLSNMQIARLVLLRQYSESIQKAKRYVKRHLRISASSYDLRYDLAVIADRFKA
jgi:hypothetical protein